MTKFQSLQHKLIHSIKIIIAMAMYIFVLLAVFLKISVLAYKTGDKYVDQEVQIEILFQPANCTLKSQMKDFLTTEYIGTFPDGRKFDSTYDRKTPMTYTMGQGDVIKGCEIATMNMCVGEKRRVIIPPKLAYGDTEYGQIPAGSTLHFDIVLTELAVDPFKAFESMNG